MSDRHVEKYKVITLSITTKRGRLYRFDDVIKRSELSNSELDHFLTGGYIHLLPFTQKFDLIKESNTVNNGLDSVIAVVPFWKRPEVSMVFWQNALDIGLKVIAIISPGDEDNHRLASKYAFDIVFCENTLGDKWQRGIERLKVHCFDYALIIGSDDIISHKYFNDLNERYLKNSTQYIGLLDALAISSESKKARYFKGYDNYRSGESIGSGRLIHLIALRKINFQCFPLKKKRGMDYYLHNKLKNAGITNTLIKSDLKPYRLGLKVTSSITANIKNSPFIYDIPLEDYYSDKVINMINNL